MKKVIAVCLSIVFLFSFAACGDDSANTSGDVIKVGVFEPITGANASGGQIEVEGIQLAHEMYGDLLGKKVELVIIDNKSDPVEAATAAAKLVEDEKVDIVVGSWGSNLALAGGGVFEDAKVVAIGASCTNPQVTLGNDYYYRVCFLDPFQGRVLADYAYNDMKVTKVGIIYEVSNDYAVGLRNFFREAYENLGGEIVADASFNTGDTDFSSQLMTVMAQNPDVIFAPGNYTEAAFIMKQARDQNYQVEFLGGDTWETEPLIAIGGDAVEGCVISSFFDAEVPLNQTTADFVARYREKHGKDPAAFTALGFDAYLTAYKAIEKAGSTDSEAIREALKTLEVEGCTGDIRFDENGDVVKTMAVLKTVKEQKFVYMDTVIIQD